MRGERLKNEEKLALRGISLPQPLQRTPHCSQYHVAVGIRNKLKGKLVTKTFIDQTAAQRSEFRPNIKTIKNGNYLIHFY